MFALATLCWGVLPRSTCLAYALEISSQAQTPRQSTTAYKEKHTRYLSDRTHAWFSIIEQQFFDLVDFELSFC
jgi:hypothetical protein